MGFSHTMGSARQNLPTQAYGVGLHAKRDDVCSEPATAPEIPDLAHSDQRHQAKRHPEVKTGVMFHLWHMSEVLPKHTRNKGNWQEDRRNDRQLLHHLIQPIRDSRQIDIQQTAHQVAIGIKNLKGPYQVIAHICKIWLRLGGNEIAGSYDQ